MITQLLNTVKEISTVNITQSAKPRPVFTYENETKANNILDMKGSLWKHQGLYPSGTTAIVGDSIINGLIEERINKKDRPIKVINFHRTTVADMEH